MEICQSQCFSKGVGHYECKFQREGGVDHQPLLASEQHSDCISCSIKISVMHYLVLSQSTGVTDRQTDRLTTPKTVVA